MSQEFNEVAAVQIISVHGRTGEVRLRRGKRWVTHRLAVLFPSSVEQVFYSCRTGRLSLAASHTLGTC